MKLAYVEVAGFRGYRKAIRVDFCPGFNIVDGRNGVGKSTIFDAVEFALTGTLSKYDDAKAAGESVADYVWWRGRGKAPGDRYVEVGFVGSEGEHSIRRTPFETPDAAVLDRLSSALCDVEVAPVDNLVRLCAASIIRDEQIASLSLDLKETDRYVLLRDALGATNAETWIEKGQRLTNTAKSRLAQANADVSQLTSELGAAKRRLDDVEARIASEVVVGDAVSRLRDLTGSEESADALISVARRRLAELRAAVDQQRQLAAKRDQIDELRHALPDMAGAVESAQAALKDADHRLQAISQDLSGHGSVGLNNQARDIATLAALAGTIGLTDGACPVCKSAHTPEEFGRKIEELAQLARQLDARAAEIATLEEERRMVTVARDAAQLVFNARSNEHAAAVAQVDEFDRLSSSQVDFAVANLYADRDLASVAEAIERDMRILETMRVSDEFERAKKEAAVVDERLTRAQERAGTARRAVALAQSLHDAARRAAGETLDQRLERVLPLMSELYRRLKPHPHWRDIEYSIRGDVRKFLRLQVGENLNPQFIFSSGQRRATGLAFLLSVKLSLAWSKWKTIMLDDPVQHVDDFRTVHLAEVAAQLVRDGQQVICAVEDVALADLLSRRLPVLEMGDAKRISVAPDEEGDFSIQAQTLLSPLPQHVFRARSLDKVG
ncbi:ATP-binding protein [Cognatilysobacter lacus]|uniref:ATP-binding protein n=1 Tax=Cognatilysobacter lacus TaxID=1643323 RepID=UPI0016591B09|nr:AAA family ATPase [Lysobacter lacus]